MNEYRGKHSPSKPWAVASTASVPVRRSRHLRKSRRRRFLSVFSIVLILAVLAYPFVEARILTTRASQVARPRLDARPIHRITHRTYLKIHRIEAVDLQRVEQAVHLRFLHSGTGTL